MSVTTSIFDPELVTEQDRKDYLGGDDHENAEPVRNQKTNLDAEVVNKIVSAVAELAQEIIDIGGGGGGGGEISALAAAIAALAAKKLLFRSPKLVNLGAITAVKASGSITVVAKASLVDGEEVAVPDGETTVHFIFDVTGSYSPPGGYDATHVRVNVSTLTTDEEVRDALWTAVGAAALNVTATKAVAVDGITLENDASGTFGNLPIVETVAAAGFAVTGMTGGAGDLLVLSVAGGEAPSEVAAVGAITTAGAVVALNATFGALSLAVVTGRNAVQPSNLVLIRNGATDDPILSDGKTVYGLLHCESASNGLAFNDTDRRVSITFVREADSTTHALEHVRADCLDGLSLNYAYVVRGELATLAEHAFLDGGFTDGVEGGSGGGGLLPYHAGDLTTYTASVGQLVTMRGPVE